MLNNCSVEQCNILEYDITMEDDIKYTFKTYQKQGKLLSFSFHTVFYTCELVTVKSTKHFCYCIFIAL